MRGFICVPREVWEWDNWPRRDAYIDLQHRACWGEVSTKSQGQNVTVQAGEVLFSVPAAAVWWRCSDKAVRLLMDWLEAQGLIAYPEGKQHRRMFRVTLVDFWGEGRGASRGATKGASRGATNPIQDNELHDEGARAGARRRARAGARHIVEEEVDKRDITVPTEPSAPVAPHPDEDLFGEPVGLKPPMPPPKEQPKPPPVEVDAASTVAQKVVALFHELSKGSGGNGVTGQHWAAQRKMAANAIRLREIAEQDALDALQWGWKDQHWRQRLRAQGMKLLPDVWSAWVEENIGTRRNGNGRSGVGGTSGEGGTAQAGNAGAARTVVNVNGRWERR